MRALSTSLLIAPAMLLAQHAALAQEYLAPEKFVVVIDACSSQGACGQYRQPFDADNEVACQMTSVISATRWMVDHPGYAVKRIACAKADERSL